MPNRIIHERICTSETMATLSADAERFFYRLIVQCDDYGRFDGRASVIRARCYPLQLDSVNESDVAEWVDDIESAGLIERYSVDGRSYLHVTTWDRYQQTRAKASKYPSPDDADGNVNADEISGNHPLSDVSTCTHRLPGDERREAISGIENRESISGSEEAAPRADDPPLSSASLPTARGKKPNWQSLTAEQRELADAFNGPLAGLTGYEESRDFLALVVTKYGDLDLAEVALGIRGHAKKRPKWLNNASILTWLRNDLKDLEHPGERRQRTNGRDDQHRNCTGGTQKSARSDNGLAELFRADKRQSASVAGAAPVTSPDG